LRSKGKSYGYENVKVVFSLIPSSKVDRFTSNQDQNDHPPIIYAYISPAEMPEIRHFCDICLKLSGMAACRNGSLAVDLLVFS